jgi:hypothetical protein
MYVNWDQNENIKYGYSVSYKKMSSDTAMFGNIDSIVMAREVVLFAAKSLI